ncbi:AraC family transcriptional regulator [Pseudoduganella sp. SL102]|uniref:helix-turn-helix domain-containing protein n=1 Tax=Pseudoduganella sp. SL102 TaxID=2995154 RepID=UPI00248D189A|nr:AraC family transcriptional regulator [Pseudoduganella sp. SL102]WBS01203.1 AraC family transcriptional regulator [Pseudoduganella sp. SL102]
MGAFYRKTLAALLCLLAGSLLLGYACVDRSYLHTPLLPARDGVLPWHAGTSLDHKGAATTIAIHEDRQRLRFGFRLVPSSAYPFAAADLLFEDRHGKPAHIDLSRYDSLTFGARCTPANTLMVSVPTFDDRVSRRNDLLSYRTPTAFFACTVAGTRVEIDLTRLETPQWWFDMFKLDLSHQAYKLDRVPKIAIGSTFQSPVNIASTVVIDALVLNGRDFRYLYALAAILTVAWSGFAVWFFRQHAAALVADVREKLQKDLPFVAYQQLSLEPHRDREKAAVLRFIATHYADAGMELDKVVAATGVNRNKLNDILKAELGFTFTAYLNKLRLTEAARLLSENDALAVAEIAYSVGYANVSYFNKLFKEEYGCTPKAFRTACAN